jgi:putative hydrolase of the HAD superfamily
MLRAVIFDLGGVVLDWNPHGILQRHFDNDAERALIAEQIIRHPDWLEMDRGTLDESGAIERFHARTGRSKEWLAAFLQSIRESLLPIPGTVALIEELRARGVPLYILSNMPTAMAIWLRANHDFFRHFDGAVISSEILMIKPEPQIFEHISQKFSLVPSETVFIDDSAANVASAAKLGFRTVHFSSPEQCSAELRALLAMRASQ